MAENNTSTIGPGVIIGSITIIVAVVSVITTLLIHNIGQVEKKADKEDAADRWTATMEALTRECSKEKDELREKITANANTALDYKGQLDNCKASWALHKEVCKCNHTKQSSQ